MGIRTIGQFAALSRTDVASRFGADAVAAHRFARGEPNRGPSGREPPPELDAVMDCDPPIDRVDAAAFAGRSLAGTLHRASRPPGSDAPGWPSMPSPPTAKSCNGFGGAPNR